LINREDSNVQTALFQGRQTHSGDQLHFVTLQEKLYE